MRKIVIIPIIVIAVIILGFSFVPLLEMNYKYSLDKANEKFIGEGQMFNDGTTRCLLKDSDGFKCKTGTGYNMDTGAINSLSESVKRDLERYGKVIQPAGQDIPLTMAELEYLNQIEEQRNRGKIDYTDILPTEIDYTKYSDNPWMQYAREALERLINSSQCKVMDTNFKMFVNAYGTLHDDREREKMMLQLVLEYREGLQKWCPHYSTSYNLDSLVGSLLIQEEIREQEYNDLLKQEPEITYTEKYMGKRND